MKGHFTWTSSKDKITTSTHLVHTKEKETGTCCNNTFHRFSKELVIATLIR